MSNSELKFSRRQFLGRSLKGLGLLKFGPLGILDLSATGKSMKAKSSVYRTINGSPSDNLKQTITQMGGIEAIVGRDDVVVIKPNVQWWNHGSVNLSSLSALVELIMEMESGFSGEVVIVENCHRGNMPWTSEASGWARQFSWNSDEPGINNMLELMDFLKNRYGKQFSLVHLINVDAGGKRVYGHDDGNGYVYCDGTGGIPSFILSNGADGDEERRTMATYPIFTTDAGTLVDFRNGVWEDDKLSEKPLKYINMAALNHHSSYCGMTSCMKNYMGIVDLSGGPDPFEGGQQVNNIYNFHSFPFNKWAKGPIPGMLGTEIAFFMNSIRRADLNIVTAEWVGFSSRVDPPMTKTRCVLASTDPVALDYHTAKYLLYANSRIGFHNPDKINSPVREYLNSAAELGAGVFEEDEVEVVSFDLIKGALEKNGKVPVRGEFVLGWSIKPILKYIFYRFSSA